MFEIWPERIFDKRRSIDAEIVQSMQNKKSCQTNKQQSTLRQQKVGASENNLCEQKAFANLDSKLSMINLFIVLPI